MYPPLLPPAAGGKCAAWFVTSDTPLLRPWLGVLKASFAPRWSATPPILQINALNNDHVLQVFSVRAAAR